MDFLMQNWMLLTVALTSGLALLWPVIAKGGGGLTPTEAVLWMNREKAMVIDVCEPGEFAAGHVTGARNVPLAQLETQLPQVVKNKSTPIILACQSGMRSGRAVALARKLGYEKVQNLTGGLRAWQDAQMPVEKA
ncbi:rhodanese-like domain-containing protein [Limnohabitans sp.]|uniref:rhodanese-like domain-containing protein n=1 Tax=Limnohabitans sp. TaxID=1907725 RepID=UPI003918F246